MILSHTARKQLVSLLWHEKGGSPQRPNSVRICLKRTEQAGPWKPNRVPGIWEEKMRDACQMYICKYICMCIYAYFCIYMCAYILIYVCVCAYIYMGSFMGFVRMVTGCGPTSPTMTVYQWKAESSSCSVQEAGCLIWPSV